MEILRTYMMQTRLNGSNYEKGDVVDVLDKFKIGTEDFPFVYCPESKDLPTRKWNDEDIEEVYVPSQRRMEAYDMSVKFLYVGDETTFRDDLEAFIDYLYGKNAGAKGSRLVIYDEHVEDGRKDVTVKSVGTELFFRQDNEDQVIAEFTVDFRVHDPVTKVGLSYRIVNQKKIFSLTW